MLINIMVGIKIVLVNIFHCENFLGCACEHGHVWQGCRVWSHHRLTYFQYHDHIVIFQVTMMIKAFNL